MTDPCFHLGCLSDDSNKCPECGRWTEKTALGQAMDIINEVGTTVKIKRALLRERLNLSEKTIDELCPLNRVDY